MAIRLSDHFTYSRMLTFAFPSICMMIFTSIYGVVDGFFISNFVGKTAFAAVNLILPFPLILGALGYMFGTGGSAVVAHALGKGEKEKANQLFSLIVFVSVIVAFTLTMVSVVFIQDIAMLLGATGEMLDFCITYGVTVVSAIPMFILQAQFQSFFVVAAKSKLGLAVTIAAGLTNLILDILLVCFFPFGVAGAALATVISQLVGGILPLFYFARSPNSALSFTRPIWNARAIIKVCTNGSSEFMTDIAACIAGIVYNLQLLKYAAEAGVAAYGTMLYLAWIFASAFMGYGIGVAPIISYHDGAKNRKEVNNVLKKSLVIILTASGGAFILSQIFTEELCKIFLSYDKELLALATNGFEIYSFSFLFLGLAIFGSAYFTALNNGLISAVIAILRTLVFEIVTVLTLPLFFGLKGIWLAPVLAELLAAALTVTFIALNKKYNSD